MTQKHDNQRHTVDLQVSFLTIFQIIKPGKDSIQWHLKNLFQIIQKCWIPRVQNDMHDLQSRVVICKYFQSDSFQGAIKALHRLQTVAFIEGWHSFAFVMRSHCDYDDRTMFHPHGTALWSVNLKVPIFKGVRGVLHLQEEYAK